MALIRGNIGIQKLTPTDGSELKCHVLIRIGVINGLQAWTYSLISTNWIKGIRGLTLKKTCFLNEMCQSHELECIRNVHNPFIGLWDWEGWTLKIFITIHERKIMLWLDILNT